MNGDRVWCHDLDLDLVVNIVSDWAALEMSCELYLSFFYQNSFMIVEVYMLKREGEGLFEKREYEYAAWFRSSWQGVQSATCQTGLRILCIRKLQKVTQT